MTDLTAQQIANIRRTWAVALESKDLAGQAFYMHLFDMAPKSEGLFKSEMDEQGRKLVETLDYAVTHLEDPEGLRPALRDLAIRHVAYGVEASHYPPVGRSLVETLKDLLGINFTEQDEEAWHAAYALLSGIMIAEAYPA